jgi:hypothetical protein
VIHDVFYCTVLHWLYDCSGNGNIHASGGGNHSMVTM